MVQNISDSNPVQKGVQSTPNPKTANDKKLLKACNDFEQMMIKQMLDAMQKQSNMFGEGFGGSYFQGIFQDEIAKKMVGNGLGLAKQIYNQVSRQSSAQPPTQPTTNQNQIDTKK